MEIPARRMARQRPDVTMAEPGMPVRPLSAGSLFGVSTLALLAGGGGASAAAAGKEAGARDDAADSDDESPSDGTHPATEVIAKPAANPQAPPAADDDSPAP